MTQQPEIELIAKELRDARRLLLDKADIFEGLESPVAGDKYRAKALIELAQANQCLTRALRNVAGDLSDGNYDTDDLRGATLSIGQSETLKKTFRWIMQQTDANKVNRRVIPREMSDQMDDQRSSLCAIQGRFDTLFKLGVLNRMDYRKNVDGRYLPTELGKNVAKDLFSP